MTPRTRTDLIVVHSSATFAHMDIGVKEITRWHRERGFAAVGYHYVIRRSGTVEQGRHPQVIGAHVAQSNRNSVGICMVGGVGPDKQPENNFTAPQWEALAALVRELLRAYPQAQVVGHRDVPGARTACPSFDVPSWWASINHTGA